MTLKPRLLPALYALALAAGHVHAQQDTTTRYEYDAQGNLTRITDPLGRITDQGYDALHRLRQQTQPAPAANVPRPVLRYTYDGLDQLTAVTDPRNLVTAYTVDGLGNQTRQVSPDTGTTQHTYDAAGNLLTRTDAKGQTTRYTYDVLNRITQIEYADGQQVTYGYDQGEHGIGRLTSMTDTSGTTAYAYDAIGRLSTVTRTVNNVAYLTRYHRNSSGQLTGITYPSGTRLAYTYDTAGRISQIDATADDQAHTLVRDIRYHPFGGVAAFVNGADQSYTRATDLDGRITSYTQAGHSQVLNYDAASRIHTLWNTQNVNAIHTYGYDNLDRLTQYSGPVGTQSLTYDATGNRTSQLLGSSLIQTGIDPASNRITQVAGNTIDSYQHDANGSLLHNGRNTFQYDARGRMTGAQTVLGPVAYQVNALGQRTQKTVQNQGTVYHYDPAGHLIAESNAAGQFQKEYVYLDDMPVAVLAK